MASQLLGIKTRFTNDLGSPLVGGQVYTYFAGTSTNQDSYSDAALTVPNTNPVILDDAGSADIFLKGSYRIRVFDKSGRFIEEQDNVTQAASQGDATELSNKVNAVESGLSTANTEINKVKLDTGITATAQYSGSVERSQADVNSDIVSIKSFPTLVAAQAYATDNNVKVFIPTGEHEYDLTDADMALFWGYGQLKDTTTGAIYKPKNGDFVTPKMFGIRAKVDETAKIKAMCMYAAQQQIPVIWESSAEYWFTEFNVVGANLVVDWRVNGGGECTLRSIKTTPNQASYQADYAILLSGVFKSSTPLLTDMSLGFDAANIADNSGINVGDLVSLRTFQMIETDNRGQAREGQHFLCRKKLGSTSIALSDPTNLAFSKSSTLAGTVTDVTSTKEFKLDVDASEKAMRTRISIKTGVSAGQNRYITSWNNTTKIAKIGGEQSALTLVAGDTFDIVTNTSVEVYSPIKVTIAEGISVERDEHLGATAEDYGYKGLIIKYGADCKLLGMSITNFSDVNLMIESCYRTLIKNIESHGANRAFGVYYGTGYGVSINQCSKTTVSRLKSSRCRRGLDVNGTQAQSWDTLVIDAEFRSCGLAYDGTPFFPFGATQSSGFGSHGAGFNTKYINCNAYNTWYAFNLRGKLEDIINCGHYGNGNNCINMFHNAGVIIDSFTYDDLTSYAATGFEQLTTLASNPCGSLVNLNTDTVRGYLPITIKNCNAKSLFSSFIRAEGTGKLPPLVLGNNTIYINNIKNPSYTAFKWIASNGETKKRISSIIDMGGNQVIDVNKSYSAIESYTDTTTLDSTALMSKSGVSSTYTLTLASNTAQFIKLPHKQSGIIVSLASTDRDRPMFADRMYLYYGKSLDYNPNNANNKSTVAISDQVLTGTTGTDLRINVAYRPTGGGNGLYVENRRNDTQTLAIEITPIG